MSQDTRATAPGRLGQALAFARSAEPRAAPSRRSVVTDIVLAALVLTAALIVARLTGPGFGPAGQLTVGGITRRVFVSGPASGITGSGWHALTAAAAVAVPLAARRVFPLSAFLVLLLGVLVTRRYATDISFLAVVFAAYSAVAHSRFRGAALLGVPLAGLVVAAAFWSAAPATSRPVPAVPAVPALPGLSGHPGRLPQFVLASPAPWRLAALVVLVSLVSIAIVGNAVHADDRIRRLRAEHEAATLRAVELERARIASELHDVVTHNVSVMIVQAGAARQVLADSPAQATTALLAVESSGRAAMSELRHLLGLLSMAGTAGDGRPAGGRPADRAGADANAILAGQGLQPQPGIGQLAALIGRVTAAGLPIELHVGAVPPGLPPGLDLTAFRVVQEALTNVIKHAGKPLTSVRVDYRDGDLVVEVADAGRPIPAAGPRTASGGRGLLGLRERTAVYGGDLTAGPQPAGGWLVRACIPVDPQAAAAGSAAAALPVTLGADSR